MRGGDGGSVGGGGDGDGGDEEEDENDDGQILFKSVKHWIKLGEGNGKIKKSGNSVGKKNVC